MKEETMVVACTLIADAGDGASKFLCAIKKSQQNEFEEANTLFQEGSHSLLQAHRLQTKLLHAEAQGEATDFSLLMVHAQDHLMNANLLKELTEAIVSLNQRVKQLEER